MQLLAQFRRCLIVGATLGLLLPPTAFAGERHRVAQIHDVALQQGGALSGVVLTSQGRAVSGKSVSLVANGELVAKSVADENGKFVIGGLRPGMYSVVAGETQTALRLWSENTAPPAATAELLLVEQQSQVVRGANGGHLPQWDHPFLVTGMLLGAGVIGGVIGYNLKDDAS